MTRPLGKHERRRSRLPQSSKKQPKKKKFRQGIPGTAAYIAPEVLKGEEHTFRLDFWSLGVIVFEFLTGNLPFNADTSAKVFENILARNI